MEQNKPSAASVSMEQFRLKCEAIREQKRVVDELEEKRAEQSGKLEAMKSEVCALMIDLGVKTFQIPGGGKLTVRKDFRVSMPKDPADREAFFEYLRGKGVFEDLVSINHQTLNSYYKQEVEASAEQGDLGFVMPGVAEPKVSEYVVIGK